MKLCENLFPDSFRDVVLDNHLMAVTTSRRWEIDWITEAVGAIFPEAWQAFASLASRTLSDEQLMDRPQRPRIVGAYAELVRSSEP